MTLRMQFLPQKCALAVAEWLKLGEEKEKGRGDPDLGSPGQEAEDGAGPSDLGRACFPGWVVRLRERSWGCWFPLGCLGARGGVHGAEGGSSDGGGKVVELQQPGPRCSRKHGQQIAGVRCHAWLCRLLESTLAVSVNPVLPLQQDEPPLYLSPSLAVWVA